MQPTEFIKKYFIESLEGKTVLDIGARGGKVAKVLAQIGCNVTAIDKDDYAKDFENTNVTFLQTNFENYQPNNIFDIVIAKNVLPFMQKDVLDKLLDTGNFIIFNIWGKKHEWAKEGNSFSDDEVVNIKNTISQKFKIHYFANEEFATKSYENQPVRWHQYTFCIQRLP